MFFYARAALWLIDFVTPALRLLTHALGGMNCISDAPLELVDLGDGSNDLLYCSFNSVTRLRLGSRASTLAQWPLLARGWCSFAITSEPGSKMIACACE
jgi:hypothetical protein